MLRKTLIACIATIGLAGCDLTSSTPTAAQVQAAAVAACNFLPTASTVANLIASNNASLSSAEAIAKAICAAVTASSGKLRGAPNVNGIDIHGRFVS